MIVKRKRDAYLDIIKGIAIIAVVFGHCIQFGSGSNFQNDRVFYDNVFRFIYSWHMPLFMLVSGYLFSFSVRRHDWLDLIASRFKQLAIPMLSWALLIAMILRSFGGGDGPFVHDVIKHFLNDIWFLWAIFYNSLLVLAVRKLFADNIFVYIGLYILTFVVPDSFNAALYKFMYPFFVCAYLYGIGKLSMPVNYIKKNRMLSLGLAVIIYVGLFSMYGYYAYIYTSGYAIVGFRSHVISGWKLWNDIYRMLIGFAGSAMLMLLIRGIYDYSKSKLEYLWNLIQKIGVASLAIYIISGYINNYVLPKLCCNFELNYIITTLETVVVIGVCYSGFLLIRKWDVVNRFLLGGR